MSEAIQSSTPSPSSNGTSSSADGHNPQHSGSGSKQSIYNLPADHFDLPQAQSEPQSANYFTIINMINVLEMIVDHQASPAVQSKEHAPRKTTADLNGADRVLKLAKAAQHAEDPIAALHAVLAALADVHGNPKAVGASGSVISSPSKADRASHGSLAAITGLNSHKNLRPTRRSKPDYQKMIYKKALAWKGKFDGNFGVSSNEACVATVNNIVHMATGKWLGGNPKVTSIDQLRKDGDVTAIHRAAARPGDFLIVESADKTMGHIGICLNSGCTDVLSNSSKKGTFSFESDHNKKFDYPGSPYKGGTATYWRANLK